MPLAELQADTPKPARTIPKGQQLTGHTSSMVQACTKILQTKSLRERETEPAGISLPVHCATQDCPATGTHQTESTRLSDSLLSQSRARSEANFTQGKPKDAHREACQYCSRPRITEQGINTSYSASTSEDRATRTPHL